VKHSVNRSELLKIFHSDQLWAPKKLQARVLQHPLNAAVILLFFSYHSIKAAFWILIKLHLLTDHVWFMFRSAIKLAAFDLSP